MQASQWDTYFERLEKPPIIILRARFIHCNTYHNLWSPTERVLTSESAEMSSHGEFDTDTLSIFYFMSVLNCSVLQFYQARILTNHR